MRRTNSSSPYAEAFTLIEMIGVLSVLTILAIVLVPVVICSIGQRLPPTLPTIPTEADFNAIWDLNDVSSAAPTNASILAGFTRGEDLKVQRVNIARLFVSLWLTTYASLGAQPLYAMDT